MDLVKDNDVCGNIFTGTLLKAMLHYGLGQLDQLIQKSGYDSVSVILMQNNQEL